ncbi:MAG: hypothetical protein IKO61_05025 [Lachnospiraceae bacterium]|nr:hypothetical protein [Lachnospiraceae bacterium]
MTLEEYMRELILMSRQYGQEEELYPLINMLLRENDNVRHLSVRDVHGSNSAGIKKEMLYGYVSFPDLVILNEKYFPEEGSIVDKEVNKRVGYINETKKLLYGCVEVKALGKKTVLESILNGDTYVWKEQLLNNKIYIKKEITPLGQLIGELLWYGKVLYTNGLCWYCLELQNPTKEELCGEIITNQLEEQQDYITNIIKPIKVEIEKKIKVHSNIIKLNGATTKFFNNLLNEYINSQAKQGETVEITCLCINIGDLSCVDNFIKDKTKRISDITDFIKDYPYIVWQWNRLKYNLASIDWCGTNKAEKFLLKPQK